LYFRYSSRSEGETMRFRNGFRREGLLFVHRADEPLLRVDLRAELLRRRGVVVLRE